MPATSQKERRRTRQARCTRYKVTASAPKLCTRFDPGRVSSEKAANTPESKVRSTRDKTVRRPNCRGTNGATDGRRDVGVVMRHTCCWEEGGEARWMCVTALVAGVQHALSARAGRSFDQRARTWLGRFPGAARKAATRTHNEDDDQNLAGAKRLRQRSVPQARRVGGTRRLRARNPSSFPATAESVTAGGQAGGQAGRQPRASTSWATLQCGSGS